MGCEETFQVCVGCEETLQLCVGSEETLQVCVGSEETLQLCVGSEETFQICVGCEETFQVCVGSEETLQVCVGSEETLQLCVGFEETLQVCVGSSFISRAEPSVGQEIPHFLYGAQKFISQLSAGPRLEPVYSTPPVSPHFNILYGVGSVYLHFRSNASSRFLTCPSACCMYPLSLLRFDDPITGS